MKILESEIITPSDSPTYDLAWRFKAAEVLAGAKGEIKYPAELEHNQELYAWLKLLYEPDEQAIKQYQRLLGWHQSELKGWLEAYLLTDSSYDAIAAELGGIDSADVELYEKVFFNVRDSLGNVMEFQRKRILHGLQGQRELTPDDILKRGVLSGGIGMLKKLVPVYDPAIVADKKSPDMMLSRLVDGEIVHRVLANTMDSTDLIRLQNVAIDRARLHYEELDRKGGGKDDGWAQVGDIMQLFAPRLIEAKRKDAEMRDQQKALDRKFAIENSIRATPVVDKGPDSMADMGRKLQARFAAEESPVPPAASAPAKPAGPAPVATAGPAAVKQGGAAAGKPVVNQRSQLNFSHV